MSNIIQDSIHEWEAEQGITDATMLASQLEVIADELRTATLVAIWQTGDIKSDGEVYGITSERRLAIWYEIAERLGMK